jgi:hypothetical protein
MSGISAYRTGITDNSAGSISVGTTYTGTKEARLAALVKPYMSTGSFFEAGRNHVGDIRDQGSPSQAQTLMSWHGSTGPRPI